MKMPLLEDLMRDVPYAVRSLGRTPGFTTIAVLTLAVAIGAGTAMYGVLNGVLMRDLAVQDQDEVVVIRKPIPAGPLDHAPVFHREFIAFQQQTRSLQSVAGFAFTGAGEQALRYRGEPLSAAGTWVTGNFFPLLGITPVHGRILRPSDDVPGTAHVMVIGYGLWQRHFGGDPAAVGHVLERDGKPFTVVGVLPRGFEFPKGAEFWVPVSAAVPQGDNPAYEVVGRLRSGASVAAAGEDYRTFLREAYGELPPAFQNVSPAAIPLLQLITGDARAMLWMSAAAVALLLLIACVNVANLLLIRGSARTREFAIRTALGARRRRLIRQLLTESGVLALLAGVLGTALAFAAVRVLVILAPPELPRREMIEIDARVLLFALGITATTALLSGLLPGILSAGGDLGGLLRRGSRTASANRGIQELRHGLVIGQVSLAVLVVVGAGLLLRSLVALQSVDLGFNEERLLVLETDLRQDLVPEQSQQLALWEDLLKRVGEIPGVIGAAPLFGGPFSEIASTALYTGEGQTAEAQAANPLVHLELIGPEYFRTMEIPFLRGRDFGRHDRVDAPRVAIVSEALAGHTWPGEDPIGKRIKLGAGDAPTEWYGVVGVVDETRYRELANPQPTLYLPYRQFGGMPMSVAVRTRVDPTGVVPQIRLALQEVHTDWMLVGGGSIRQLLAAPLARPRFSTLLLGAFATMTLLLAVVGIYGAITATVRQRTREIGIRLALGARVEEVRALVLRQGLRLALLGCAIGIGAALFATRMVRSLLFGISPTDPATFVSVAVLILGATALACYLPARRASMVDPVNTLRVE